VLFSEQRDLFYRLISGATSTGLPAEWGDLFGDSHRSWLLATEERVSLAAVWADWFGSYDILVCPVLPTAASPHDHAGGLFDRTLVVDGRDVPHVELVGWVGMIGVLGGRRAGRGVVGSGDAGRRLLTTTGVLKALTIDGAPRTGGAPGLRRLIVTRERSGAPRLSDRGDVPVIGATASAEHP
jgi:hypothetical protein